MKKGDEFWMVQTASYSSLLPEPILRHGVVTGGGESLIIVQWDGDNTPVKSGRYQFEKQVHTSKEEALKQAAFNLHNRSRRAADEAAQLHRLALQVENMQLALRGIERMGGAS